MNWFSDRKKLTTEYEKWLAQEPELKDCAFNVISFLESKGLLKSIDEVPTAIFRPTELYAVEDCISGKIIFNARGGCYKDIADVTDKIARLTKENGGTYRVVKYVLSAN